MAKKKVAPKAKKKRAPAKPKVTLQSYAIKMVIPTGNYANIQPEIIVKSTNIDAAHDYIAPHMNKLWKEYYLINERRVEPTVAKPVPPAPKPEVTPVEPKKFTPLTDPIKQQNTPVEPPTSSVALSKATQAIESCMSLEAFDLIAKQVEVSTKLSNEDKNKLMPMLAEKFDKLSQPKTDVK